MTSKQLMSIREVRCSGTLGDVKHTLSGLLTPLVRSTSLCHVVARATHCALPKEGKDETHDSTKQTHRCTGHLATSATATMGIRADPKLNTCDTSIRMSSASAASSVVDRLVALEWSDEQSNQVRRRERLVKSLREAEKSCKRVSAAEGGGREREREKS